MANEAERITIKVGERESVTGLVYSSARGVRADTTIVLGHGAGANQLSGFLRLFATGLAARGLDTMTFNFLYSEHGRRVPDPKAKLESCYDAAIKAARAHRKLKANRLIIGGKSMGGRIASLVAATGIDDLSGLVFLGYPLHPPGKPEQLRAEHLNKIRAPMLFMQGSRDAFGRPDELRDVIKKLRLFATLYEVAGGDHSFKVLKSAAVPQHEVYDAAMDEIVRWLNS